MTAQLSQSDLALLRMAKAFIGQTQKNDPIPATDIGWPMMHGPGGPGALGGMLSYPGVSPDMVSAIPTALFPLFSTLWAGVTVERSPLYEMFTGITQTSWEGNDSTIEPCGEYPTAGTPKVCMQSAYFGDFRWQTPTRELNTIGARVNIGETDRRMVNLAIQQHPLMAGLIPQTDVNNQLFWDVYSGIYNIDLVLGQVLFQGDVASGVNGSNWRPQGVRLEFDGFDKLITTGIVDTITGTACPAADSVVEDYTNHEVFATGSEDIVEILADIVYRQYDNARMTGFATNTFAFMMHPDLFRRLTMGWPCSYLTDRCSVDTTNGEAINLTGEANVRMRDEMRNGSFLWIDGMRIPVIQTHGMSNTPLGPGFVTDIYLVHLVGNGQRMTYLEGYDQTGGGEALQYLNYTGATSDVGVTAGGALKVMRSLLKDCINYSFKLEPRLIVRTPFLNARLQNVVYSLRQYSRSPFHNDEYYVDGGGRYRPNPTFKDFTGGNFPHLI